MVSLILLWGGWSSMVAYSKPASDFEREQAAGLVIDGVKEDIANFHVVTQGVLRGGQPTNNGLFKLKAAGIRTIINLRNEEVLVAQEKACAQKLGLHFYNIPLDVFNEPQSAQIKQFLEILKDDSKQPVFVHCLHGQDRTGCMIATYRIGKQGWSAKKAYEEMLTYGFHPVYFNLTRAVFGYAADLGRPEALPSASSIVNDLTVRLSRFFSR